MIKIIVIGDQYNEFSNSLSLILKEYSDVLLITAESIKDYSLNDTNFLICSLEKITDIRTDNAIIVFKQKYNKAKFDNIFWVQFILKKVITMIIFWNKPLIIKSLNF